MAASTRSVRSLAEFEGGSNVFRRLTARRWILASFLAGVAIPTICAALYFQFVAPAEYLAEARFAIRGTIEGLPGSDRIGGALGQLVALNDTQEAHIVAAYINSSAIVRKIGGDADLGALFGGNAPIGGRLLSSEVAPEAALAFWNRHVVAEVDMISGVTTLRVRAFAAREAVSLSRRILEIGEQLANSVSERVEENAVASSAREVEKAVQAVQSTRRAQLDYRDARGLLDPWKTAASASRILEKLQVEQRRLELQLRVTRETAGENSPPAENLRRELASLNGEVERMRRALTDERGDDRDSLSSSIQAFERLELDGELAEHTFLAASDDLARAKSHAARRRVYLEAYDPPALVSTPSNFLGLIRVFAGSSVLWGLAMLSLAGLRDFGS